MAEEHPNSSAEIFVIPPEYYGGAMPSLLPKEVKAATKRAIAPHMPIKGIHVPKEGLIAGGVILFLVAVGLIAWYYIRQSRPRQIVSPPRPVPIVTPVIPALEPTSPSASTSTEPTPAIPEAPPSSAPDIFSIRTYGTAKDTDGDGLTDEEEVHFLTDAGKPDTDGDGYVDGLEIRNGYNASGIAPERLLDAGIAARYQNEAFGYSFLYPRAYLARALDDTETEVMVSPPSGGEFFEVIVEENQESLPIVAWYLARAPGARESDMAPFATRDNAAGIKSPDRLTAYIPWGTKVFVIAYHIGIVTEVHFLTTFEMMVNSFTLPVAASPLEFAPETATTTAVTTAP